MLEGLGQAAERPTTAAPGVAQQAQKDLGRQEGIPGGRMAVIGIDLEALAQGIQREAPDWRQAHERSVVLQIQSQTRGVQVPVFKPDAELALARGVEHGQVVIDVMPYDDSVAKVIEKLHQGLALAQGVEGLGSCDSVNQRSNGIVTDPKQSFEAVRQEDLGLFDGNGTDAHDTIPCRAQAGGFAIEHH